MRKGFAVNLKDHRQVNDGFAAALPDSHCFLCAGTCEGREAICVDCLNDLAFNVDACPACAKPNATSGMCANCLIRPNAYIDSVWVLFRYHYPVNYLIQQMKFKQGFDLSTYLGGMLSDLFLNNGAAPPDCIMPVPLHISRLISRGYNQSAELARPLSKQLSVKLDTAACKRIRATIPQTDLPAKKRKQNVHNAFSVAGRVPYNHVLLVDDVITTGSTVNELALTLHHAGVKKIDVLACAKAG